MAYSRNSKHRRDYRGEHKKQKRNKRNNHIKQPHYNSSRPSNLTVYLREDEDPMRAIKRFIKKCKKLKIIEQYREKEYFVKPSKKRRLAEKQRQRTIQKIQREQNKE
jgi:ribosomal protein S21